MQRLSLAAICPDPKQPRRIFPEEELADLAANLRAHGQQVPLIVFPHEQRFLLADGERRWRAAQILEWTELDAVVRDAAPTPAELLLLQLTVNCQRSDLTPVEKLHAYVQLMRLQGWNATQLAEGLQTSKASVSAILALARLTDEQRQLVAQGRLSLSGAYALARMAPEERAATLAREGATGLTRDRLQAAARKRSQPSGPKTVRLRCPLEHAELTVAAPAGLDLTGFLDLLDTLLREGRKARSQGLDVTTFARVLQDRAARTAS